MISPQVPESRSPAEPMVTARAIIYTGPQRIVESLPHLDHVVDCLDFRDPDAGSLRQHSGLHPQIRARTRQQDELYSRKKQDVLQYIFENPIPGNGVSRHEYRFAAQCRAGRHRSVSFAEELGIDLREAGMAVNVIHLNDHNWPCVRGRCHVCRESC